MLRLLAPCGPMEEGCGYCPGPGPGSLWRRECLLLPNVTGTTVLMVAMALGPMVVKSPAGGEGNGGDEVETIPYWPGPGALVALREGCGRWGAEEKGTEGMALRFHEPVS
jgi:hypothetical protein